MKLFSAFLAAALMGSLYSPEADADRGDRRSDRSDRRGDRGDRRGDRNRHGRDYRGDRHDRDRNVRYPGYRRPVYPYPGYYYPGYPYDSGYTEVSCSPEVKQKNVAIVEKTLNGLLVTPTFKDAAQLRETLSSIQANKNIEARIAAYTSLVGVDAKNASELAEFVGARDLGPYVEYARDELGLSDEQADVLVNTLSENLLNGINN